MIIGCDDCKTTDIMVVMLNDELWITIANKKDILCIDCIEKRLGRKVTLHDLRPCGATYSIFLGAYIGSNTPELLSTEVLKYAPKFVNHNWNWEL